MLGRWAAGDWRLSRAADQTARAQPKPEPGVKREPGVKVEPGMKEEEGGNREEHNRYLEVAAAAASL